MSKVSKVAWNDPTAKLALENLTGDSRPERLRKRQRQAPWQAGLPPGMTPGQAVRPKTAKDRIREGGRKNDTQDNSV